MIEETETKNHICCHL